MTEIGSIPGHRSKRQRADDARDKTLADISKQVKAVDRRLKSVEKDIAELAKKKAE